MTAAQDREETVKIANRVGQVFLRFVGSAFAGQALVLAVD